MDTTLPTQPSSYTQVIRRSFGLYLTTFKDAIALSLILAVVVFIPRLMSLSAGYDVFASLPPFSPLRFLFLIIEIVGLILFISVLWRIYSHIRHKHEAIKEDLVIGFRKVWAVIVASLIQLAVIAIVMIAFYLIQLAISLNPDIFIGHPIRILILCLIFVLPILVTIYVYTLFYFLIPLIAIENKGIIESLKRSAQLVWHHWWRTFAVQITPWIGYLIALIILRFIFRIDIHIYFIDYDPHSLLAVVLHIIVFALFIPFAATTMLVQLKDLELRKKLKRK